MPKFRIRCEQLLHVTQEVTFEVEAESLGAAVKHAWNGALPGAGWRTTRSVVKDYSYASETQRPGLQTPLLRRLNGLTRKV